MSNCLGKLFRLMTWGESHGPALGAVVDGCPANLPLSKEDIAAQLDRDVPDKEIGTPRGERNKFQILSGVFEGRTLGTPISLVIWNNDINPVSYEPSRDTLRPGHADFTYYSRYKHTDWRGGSRASGRECIARLAGGAIARKLIETLGITFSGNLVELAGVRITSEETGKLARGKALELGEKGDSTGGVIELRISGLPAGLGAPVFGKLHADLAQAFLTIGGVKGFETGIGFEAARATGSSHNDPFAFDPQGNIVTVTNKCGGLLGGISTGSDLVFRLAVKPTPTIALPQNTVNVSTKTPVTMEYQGRFDRNFAPRILPIAEAMAACVLADHLILSGFINPCHL